MRAKGELALDIHPGAVAAVVRASLRVDVSALHPVRSRDHKVRSCVLGCDIYQTSISVICWSAPQAGGNSPRKEAVTIDPSGPHALFYVILNWLHSRPTAEICR